MHVKAHLRNIRISPRKVRIVAALVRGRNVGDAKTQLTFLMRKAALPIIKLIDSAVANATHNFKLDPKDLYISEIFVNEGQTLKRGMPRARGSSYTIRKRMSHISLTLSEKKDRNMTHTGKKVSQKKMALVMPAKKTAKEEGKSKKAMTHEKKPAVRAQVAKKPAPTGRRLTGIARRAFHAHEDK
ncbi:50S ribosomal protein L22 [Candidatus Azambacteria bacterium]|nr:50S ribosomal protein L22 [Candidatus Azambacteria bacterium]